MFRKLVSNLPFNPSLITQVSFYSDRLKKERAVRSLGFFFIIASMFLQMFAVVVPPQKSLAADGNHILDGMSSANSTEYNRNFLLNSWDQNADVRAIYSYFGLTRSDLENTVKDTIFTAEADYWTTGRNSLSGYSKVQQKYKNTQITIEYQPGRLVYMRELRAWDIINKNGQNKTGLRGTIGSTGETFWILYDCGNFTKIGKYIPPPPPPPPPPVNPLTAVCSIAGPIIIGTNDKQAKVPVRITLPAGKGVPAGSTTPDGAAGKGLHLGIATKGAPSTWNIHDGVALAQAMIPPDKQTDYLPLSTGNNGLSYYDFNWSYDGASYRRYYVTSAHSASFDVTMNVQVNKNDKTLVVRLLDRDLGQWLAHSSSCETSISREVPPPPSPNLEIKKTIIDKKASYKPGDEYSYLIQYRNTVNASLAENIVITDELDTRNFDVVSVNPAEARVTNGFMRFEAGNLPYSTAYRDIRITVRLKDQISSGTTVCNASRITASNASAKDSERVCLGVITPCPYDNNVPDINNPNCSEPKLVCELVDAAVNLTTRKVTFRTTATSSNPATTRAISYTYDFGDGSPVLTEQVQALTHQTTHTYAPGDFDAKVTISYTAQGVDGRQQIDCAAPISFEADKPFGQSKIVKNITQDKSGDAAINSVVQANDVLEYTLTTTNAQNYERTGVVVSDYVGDILDYAQLDSDFLKQNGGSFDEATKKVVWNDVVIPANGQVLHTFRVKMKELIPSTNRPSSMTTGYDCKISNEYGNEISINVNCPLVKGIETLPNTGPGSSIVMLGCITTVVGYFFARNRILAKELDFVRQDYATTGGM